MVDDEYIQEAQEHINQFGDDPEESDSFVTKDQHDNFVTQEDEGDQEPIGNEQEDSHIAYLNALSEFNRQYDQRNISVVVAPPKKVAQGQASTSQPARTQLRKKVVQQKPLEKDVPKDAPPKDKELPKEIVPIEKDLHREEIKRDLLLLTCRMKFPRSKLLSLLMKY